MISNNRCSQSQKMATLTLLALLATVVAAETVTAADSELLPAISALEGQQVDILCHRNVSLRFCRVEVPNEEPVFILSEKSTNSRPGFAYYGAGHANGDCGISIRQLKQQHDGVVRCFLGTESDEMENRVPLRVAIAPQRPKIDIVSVIGGGEKRAIQPAVFEVDDEVTFKCVSPNGRPAAQLTWFLDGKELISDNVSATETISTPASGSRSLARFTAIRTVKLHMQTADDGKNLTCHAVQPETKAEPQVAQLRLTVGFRPQPQPRRFLDVAAGQTALINVTVSANPPPNTTWIVAGERIEQGGHNGRFAALEPIGIGNGAYNVTLSIVALQPEDADIEYALSASNQFGKQEYLVQLSATQPAQGEQVGAGASRSPTAITMLVALGAVALLLAAVVIAVARITGKCWFGRGREEEEEEESAQEKV